MLLSNKERLAEASISLIEIKATKKLISEAEISDENEEIKEKIKVQLRNISKVYTDNLKPLLAKTNMRSFEIFVNNVISNTQECADYVSRQLSEEDFQRAIMVLSRWYNLGTALALFLKRIPSAVAGFKGFRSKSSNAGADSDSALIDIFDDVEIEGIKKRLISAANDPIRIMAIMTKEEMKAQAREMQSVNAKFTSSDLPISQYIELIKKAMATNRQESELGVTNPAEFNINKIAEELTTSSLASINPMLGNNKVPKEKPSDKDIIYDFLDPEGKDADKYKKLMEALANEIKMKIGEDQDTSDLRKFVKSINQLLKDKKLEEKDLLNMIKEVTKEIS